MKMRKYFCIVLTLCMLLCMMSVGASATYMGDDNHVTADTASNTDTAGIVAPAGSANGSEVGSADVPVYIQASTATTFTNGYAISYDLDELVFVYNASESLIWNPETLMYEGAKAGTWTTTTQDITVTNYSDIPVKVTPSNTTPADTGITVTLGDAIELDSAYDGDRATAGTAKSDTIAVTISGAPTKDYIVKTLLTTITMTVTDNR